MDRTASNRALASQLGVSETAVRRAEEAGRIHREPDGAWDLVKVRAAWAGNTDPAQQRGELSAGNGNRKARNLVRPVPEAALGAVRETLREHGEPIAAGAMTFMQARTPNEVLKAHAARAVEPTADLHPAARADQGEAHLMTVFQGAVDATFTAFGIDAFYTPPAATRGCPFG
jgi:hypothetical protein